MKNDEFVTKRQFLERIFKDFLYRSTKEKNINENLKNMYDGYKILLDNQLIKSGNQTKQIQELHIILDKTYKLFSDKEAREKLVSSNLKANDIIEKYGEKILGDNKRNYNMSSMYNSDLIGTVNTTNGERKNINYISRESDNNSQRREFVLKDEEGKIATISCIGELHYVTSFGVEKYINKYRVSRQIDENLFKSNEVFGNISIVEMSNPEYRDVVFSELLGENNISLSNAGGYIGTISKSKNKLARGEQETVAGVYTYRINDKYCIEYDSEDLSAVMLYQNEQQEKNKNNKQREEESR